MFSKKRHALMSASLACLHSTTLNPRVELTTHAYFKAHNENQINFTFLLNNRIFFERILKDRPRRKASASLAWGQPFSLAPRETYNVNFLTHSVDILDSG